MASKQELMRDERFSHITKDPRFWEMPDKERKIKIDKRFRAMFHDKKFKLKYTVDKRGRPVNHSSTEDLKRFYELSDSDSELSESDNKVVSVKEMKKKSKSKGNKDSGKLLVNNVPKEERKRFKQETDQRCQAVSEFGDIQNKAQKRIISLRTSTLKKDCKKISVVTDPMQDSREPVLQAVNKQKDISSQSKTKTSKAKSAQSMMVPKATCSTEGKNTGSVQRKENEVLKSEGSFSFTDSEDVEIGEEEESEDVEEMGEEEEELEDDEMGEVEEVEDEGEAGEEDYSDSEEDDESDGGPDLARGKGNVETSSDDEDEDDLTEFLPKEPELEHAWRELDKDAPRGNEITSRLAVCNMDWDRIKAKDLLALFNSFTPKGAVIFSVKIYPSEFGKERLKKEELQGPVELLSLPENATETDGIHTEKLREYQFKRLKYFYAVVECDSPETANKIYEDCDGLEFESSCSFVDLRFIPDNVTFDDEPKDVALEMDGAAYKPKYFTSAAMGTSKVDVTWDETDHERVTSLSRTFKKDELLDMDFQAYLASSSEEEQEGHDVAHQTEDDKLKRSQKDDEEQIARYRELLQSIQEKEKKCEENDMEMEIKWVPGLKETAEEMVKKKLEGKDKLTPWEQFLEKKREKRKVKKKRKAAAEELSGEELPSDVDLNDPYFAEELGGKGLKKKVKKSKTEKNNTEDEAEIEKQKAEMALLMMDDENDDRKHFNYDKIVEQQNLTKKKKKLLLKKEELIEDDFEVNVADARFQAMYTSHLFNLDPSDPNFKKTKAVKKILEEKARRREQQQQDATEAEKKQEADIGKKASVPKKSIDPALSLLIKSVKNKTEQFQARKKQKVK
ncbi:ESF1 homolog [Alligator mississippiensis]|uniref:ESF1 homolog n=1 Tax=Alligator mississippiensis TaxID=8496 RepID=UPI0003D0ACCA|nr:ESF1 homolog [Alligator mississippiensis]XP_019356322.1 ESF1 homolog [Alligator mississippiensis]